MRPPLASTRHGPRRRQAPPARVSSALAPGSSGFALLLALLVLLALGTLGTGLLFVSSQEARVSRALVHAVRARTAAESAARAALADWNASAYRHLAPGGAAADVALPPGALGPGVDSNARVERLAGGLFLVRGEARSGPPSGAGAHAAVGLLARTLLPAEFAPDLAAALSVAGPVELLAGAVVDGTGGSGTPTGWAPSDCPPDSVLGAPGGPRPGLAIPDAALVKADPGAVLDGAPPLVFAAHLADSSAFAGFGPLGMADLARLADRVETGTLPAPPGPVAGACDTAAPGTPGNPADPGSPCGGEFPLIFAPAGLTISGASQGVLIVDGDLDLAPGAAFTGAILATGRLTLAPGASITGAARAREASISGTVRFDACALARALAGAPGLGRPLRPAARSWVPIF